VEVIQPSGITASFLIRNKIIIKIFIYIKNKNLWIKSLKCGITIKI